VGIANKSKSKRKKLLEKELKKFLHLCDTNQIPHYKILRELRKASLQQQKEIIHVPVSIFSDPIQGCFEALVRYLHEQGLRKSEISKRLGRDQRTIWKAYQESLRKIPKIRIIQESSHAIPLSLFKNRTYSVLEHISYYLKSESSLPQKRIAELLGRSPKTIWTALHRYSIKGDGHE